MKKIGTILTLLFCVSAFQLYGQNIQIRGIVTDASDNSPLPGAFVTVKGSNTGTSTLNDGSYTITASSNAVLVFSFIGMRSQEIQVGGRNTINVALVSDTQLEEVVVVGYGVQTQRSLASSITTVRADKLKDIPSPSFDQALQGRAAGVSITNPSAGVGQSPVVIIRGVSSINSGTQPLYIVDGIPIMSGNLANFGSANALADINPADIESMTILKDAAASAIYGSRAANGVIMITTKQGKQGTMKLTYDMNIGFSVPTNFWDVMNAKEYVDFKNSAVDRVVEARKAANLAPLATVDKFALWDLKHQPYTGSGPYVDSNWPDAVFKKGTVQNHTASISNATDKADFYFSINSMTQGGIVIGDSYDRVGIRGAGNLQANKYIKVGMSANFSHGHTHFTDAARNGQIIATAGYPRSALILPPNIPIRKLDGTPYFEATSGIGRGPNTVNCVYFNPVALHELGNGIDTWVNRMIATTYAELTPLKGLRIKTQFGVDYASTKDKRQWTPYHGDGGSYMGMANAALDIVRQWTWTNTASYHTTIAQDHDVSATVGMESNKSNGEYFSVQGTLSTDYSFMGIESNFTNYSGSGDLTEKTLVSYFANANYSYKGKYLLSGNFRRDGYSPLGVNARWGNFWGVAGAWRVSEERFFGNLRDIFSDLKVKASYGVVGNAAIAWYASKSWYGSGYYGGAGTVVMSTIGGGPNLKWESSATLNLGLETTLFNRISIQAEWYQKKSIDLILSVTQAPSTGLGSIRTNAGQLQNRGLELSISADVVRAKDFTWSTSLNFATNQNKVLKLVDDIPHSDANYTYTISKEGYSLAQLYVYPTGGIDPQTGRRIFYDVDGKKVYHDYSIGSSRWLNEDGTTSTALRTPKITANTLPTYFGGWLNNFYYKGFDLNLFLQFSGGNYIYNGMRATSSDMRFWNNTKEVLNKHWSEQNRNSKYAKPYYGDNVSNGSAFFMSDDVEKGDYLRFKNVSLGYTFKTKNWGKKIDLKVSSLRIYAQVQNLFTITGYTGLDPETITKIDSPTLMGGVDKNTLPQAISYTLGLNISF